MASLIDFRLYLVTDRRRLCDSGDYSASAAPLLRAVREALKGGVQAVQVREKDLETRQLLSLSYGMRKLTRAHHARLFVNDRFDIALAVSADGVHLTQNSIPVADVRRTVGKKLLIGVSTHSMREAREAEQGGADFITAGPVFPTPSKLRYGPPLGTTALKKISNRVSIPVFAIGGIKKKRVRGVLETGAHGVAMISEILGKGNVREKTEGVIAEI